MKLELRKISHTKSLSEETPAYTAQVWANGVHVCDVSNHGQGGCDMQYPAKGKTRSDIDALNLLVKSTFPKQSYIANGEKHEFDTDLELWCHVELGRIDLEKTVKRDLANKVMFVKPDGKLYQISTKKLATVDRKVALIADLRAKGCKVLNEMTLADAVKVYETAGA